MTANTQPSPPIDLRIVGIRLEDMLLWWVNRCKNG